MNGLAAKHYVIDCALESCKWVSEPLRTTEAAHEALRSHINSHTHGELVEHIASSHKTVAEYSREPA